MPTFQEVIRRCPDLTEAHYALGLCYRVLGNDAEAIRELREAVRLTPTPTYLEALGVLYIETNDWPEALAVTDRLWDADEMAALRIGFGIIGARTLPIVESDQEGVIAGERYSPEVQTLIMQGSQLIDQGRAPHARTVLQEAVEKDPHAIMAWFMLAKIHSGMGNVPRTVEVMEAAAKANPNRPIVLHPLGWLYYATRRYEEAKTAWEAIKPIDVIAYRTCEKLVKEMERGVFRNVTNVTWQ